MRFSFAELVIPPIPDRLKGPKYERLKATIATLLLSQRLEVFHREGGDRRWAPLSAAYARRRQAAVVASVSRARLARLREKGHGEVKILHDSGILRQSFTSETGPGNRFRETILGEDDVSIASHVPYARIQNEGGTINWPGTRNGFGRGVTIPAHSIAIPARPFDEFSERDTDQIYEVVDQLLNFDGNLINGKL